MLDTLADVQILALTLFGEARSEPIEGIVSAAAGVGAGVCSQRASRDPLVLCRHPLDRQVYIARHRDGG